MLRASLLAVALAVAGASAQLTINTPAPGTLVQCQNALITWAGSTGGVSIVVYRGGGTADVFEKIPDISGGNQYTWLVDMRGDQNVTFQIRELSTGATAVSAPAIIGTSDITGCLGRNPGYVTDGFATPPQQPTDTGSQTSPPTSSPPPTGGSSTPPPTGGSTTPPPTGGSSTTPRSSSTTSGSTPPPTGTPDAALALGAPVALALGGLVAVAASLL